MKWTRYSLQTTTAAVDLISSMLYEMGIEGIEIEDKVPLTENEKRQMFVDILPQAEPDDGRAVVNFYLDPGDCPENLRHPEDVCARVAEGLLGLADFVDIGEGTVRVSETEDKDWVNNWKEFFHAFRIGEDIVVKPTWEDEGEADVRPGDLVLEIDPGISFGTGAHETTKLCIEALRRYVVEGSEVLDVGCGSGILSITAVKLGAAHALAIDIDPIAVEAAGENRETNHVPPEKLELLAGNLIDDEALRERCGEGRYDMIVANILADVLIPMTPAVAPMLKEGGLYITSGILDTREGDVRAAVEAAGLTVKDVTRKNDWVAVIAVKGA